MLHPSLQGGRFGDDDVGNLIERAKVGRFTTKREVGDNTGSREGAHAARGKPFRRGDGVYARQFEHNVRAARQRPGRAGIFIGTGGFAPLNKVAAHHDNAVIRPGKRTRALQMVDMPVMQRIVLRNDSDYSHIPQRFHSIVYGMKFHKNRFCQHFHRFSDDSSIPFPILLWYTLAVGYTKCKNDGRKPQICIIQFDDF
jgi:hypothetical protein